MNKNRIPSVIHTVVMIIGIIVCFICDIAISGRPTWSLITLSSIAFAWAVTFPLVQMRRKGVPVSMIAVSILIVPFLFILGILLGSDRLFPDGTVMSVIGIVFMWIIYLFYRKLNKILATGISFLVAIPVVVLVNLVLSKMIGGPLFEVWDMLSMFVLLIVAVSFIGLGLFRAGNTKRNDII